MATLIEQLEAMRLLNENWDGYGAAVPQGAILDLAQELTRLIQAILDKSGTEASELHVTPTRIGGVLIEWEERSAQHEVELNPDCSISFLHFDKGTGQVSTQKFVPGTRTVVDPGFLRELRQLLAA
jgi:hypothetical protein